MGMLFNCCYRNRPINYIPDLAAWLVCSLQGKRNDEHICGEIKAVVKGNRISSAPVGGIIKLSKADWKRSVVEEISTSLWDPDVDIPYDGPHHGQMVVRTGNR